MSTKAFKHLPDILKKSVVPSKIKVSAANGSSMTVKGSLKIPMVINSAIKVTHTFYVIEELQRPMLIGSDLLKANRLNLTFDGQIEQANTIKVHETKCVTPFSECMIIITTSYPNQQLQIEPISEWSELIPSAIIQTDKHGKSSLLCQNPTNNTIKMTRKMIVGLSQVLPEESIVNEIKPMVKTIKRSKSKVKPSDLVKLNHLPQKLQEKVKGVIDAYPDVFSLDPNDIGHCTVIPQKIMLKDNQQVACTPPYRIAPNLQPVVHEYVDKLLNAKVIQKSTSPFCSPLLLVNKAGSNPSQPLVERYRVVHDFRRLNQLSIRDAYPLHNLYDLIDKVASAKVWSVIDLSSGFWNQSLHPASRPYTAFSVPGKGHFEYLRTAQGLCNSPAAFQRLLDFVVRDIPGVFVYIDDVVIATNDLLSHLKAIEEVFRRFRQYNLKCRPKKIQLVTAEINYLGYNLTQEHGIRAGQAKIDSLIKYKPPTNVTEVRQFLGLCSFFRRTIPDFAAKAQPLTKLTRKDSPWKEGTIPPEAMLAFHKLKNELTKRPCLKPPNFNETFYLTIDASTYGLGAILSQKDATGIEKPVAYGSRALSDTEKKYAPFRLEYLAMVWGCKHFKPYLIGKPFVIRTDHKPLLSFNKVKGSVFDRYLLELSEFDFSVEHLPGKQMPADGLSRQHVEETIINLSQMINIGLPQLRQLQQQDKYLKALAIYLKYNSEPKNDFLKRFVQREHKDASLRDGILLKGDKAFAPKGLQTNLIRLAHDSPASGHYSNEKTLAKLQSWYWDSIKDDVNAFCRSCPTCNIHNPAKEVTFPLQPLKPANCFNDRVHIDLLGPLPNNNGHKYVLVMVDAYSRFLQLAPAQTKEMNEISQLFYAHWISTFGPCQTIVSDRGTEMRNSLWKTLESNLGITHGYTSPYHPQSNGLSERQVRTVLEYVRKYVDGNDWLGLLSNIQFAHNTVPSRGTGYSPYEAVFGTPCKLPTNIYQPVKPNYAANVQIELSNNLKKISQAIRKAQEPYFLAMKRVYDKRCSEKQFREHDKVQLVRGHKGTKFQKFQQKFEGTYILDKIYPTGAVKLIDFFSKKIKYAHSNNIRLLPFLSAFPEYQNDLKRGENGKESKEQKPNESSTYFDDDLIFPREKPTLHTIPPSPESPRSPLMLSPSPSSPSLPSPFGPRWPSSSSSNNSQDERTHASPPRLPPRPMPRGAEPKQMPSTRMTRSKVQGNLPDAVLHKYPEERKKKSLGNRLRNMFSP